MPSRIYVESLEVAQRPQLLQTLPLSFLGEKLIGSGIEPFGPVMRFDERRRMALEKTFLENGFHDRTVHIPADRQTFQCEDRGSQVEDASQLGDIGGSSPND